MKKIIICILLIMSCSCSNKTIEEKKTIINVNADNKLEYGQEAYIKDYISIVNGNLIDETIEYDDLGIIDVNYSYNDVNNKKKSGTIQIDVIDSTQPYINYSSKYTTKIGKNRDILSEILCADNYDRNLVCTLEGSFNINKLGDYDLKITATDISGNKTEVETVLSVVSSTSNSSSKSKEIKEIINNYKTDNTTIGIDVSSWQENIDFKKVKNDGVDAVMIRMGYGHNSKGELIFDNKYKTNYKNAKEAGLLVGIYFYSYAQTKEEAIKQADWIINNLNGDSLELPIAFDWESWSKFDDYNLNIRDINQIANAFLNEVENKGYKGMLYSSLTYLNHIWDTSNYETWLAHYTDRTSYEKEYRMWQLTNKGKVNGIKGNVDVNIIVNK